MSDDAKSKSNARGALRDALNMMEALRPLSAGEADRVTGLLREAMSAAVYDAKILRAIENKLEAVGPDLIEAIDGLIAKATDMERRSVAKLKAEIQGAIDILDSIPWATNNDELIEVGKLLDAALFDVQEMDCGSNLERWIDALRGETEQEPVRGGGGS